jgi:hypothetical protein
MKLRGNGNYEKKGNYEWWVGLSEVDKREQEFWGAFCMK